MRLIIRTLCLVLACCLVVFAEPPQTPVTPYRALLNQYCTACHNERAKTAGLMLDKMDVDHPADSADVWEKVVRKLRGGMMPPTGRPRPSSDDAYKLITYLENSLDRAAANKPN